MSVKSVYLLNTRVIKQWNKIPASVVEAPSLEVFEVQVTQI